MKTRINLGVLCLAFTILFSCGSENEGARLIQIFSLQAAIGETCEDIVNYQDFEDEVYAYRADAIFGTPSIQAGGHGTANQTTDLGANIFLDLDALATGLLSIDEGSAIPGTAYVFYKIDGEEFISTENNEGNLNLLELELREDGSVSKIKFTFNNVEVENNTNPGDYRCVNLFELEYSM